MTPEPLSSAAQVRVESIRFSALDGYPLGGTLYAPVAGDEPANAVVFATGTGVRAAVYRWFLTYLASAGLPVLAFDYRGIGDSRPANLRGFEAGFEDWTEYDAGAAIRYLRRLYPRARLAGVGHSAGAMIVGATEEADEFTQIVAIAPHTGYFGDHRPALRLAMQFGWRPAARLATSAFGYFPARLLGGEDLPARAALQWSACAEPGFEGDVAREDGERVRRVLDNAARLRVPTLVISFADDRWATEIGVRRFLHGYRNLLAVRRVVTRSDVNDRRIGHWEFFKRSFGASLWPIVTGFLVGHSKRASSLR